MSAMNVIRALISVFIVLLVMTAAMGWQWTGAHQPAAQAVASRVVLAAATISGFVGLVSLWRRT